MATNRPNSFSGSIILIIHLIFLNFCSNIMTFSYRSMDISKALCPDCKAPLSATRLACPACKLTLDGDFEVSPLGKLNPDDQAFVVAFVRHHGSLKKMESIFGISYPTVKNRLNAIAAALDKNFQSPSPNLYVLEQLSRGELTVEETLDKLS
jgi:hypothetical protein